MTKQAEVIEVIEVTRVTLHPDAYKAVLTRVHDAWGPPYELPRGQYQVAWIGLAGGRWARARRELDLLAGLGGASGSASASV